jgi:hypothetical protein
VDPGLFSFAIVVFFGHIRVLSIPGLALQSLGFDSLVITSPYLDCFLTHIRYLSQYVEALCSILKMMYVTLDDVPSRLNYHD